MMAKVLKLKSHKPVVLILRGHELSPRCSVHGLRKRGHPTQGLNVHISGQSLHGLRLGAQVRTSFLQSDRTYGARRNGRPRGDTDMDKQVRT
jgi:hypothetical protein